MRVDLVNFCSKSEVSYLIWEIFGLKIEGFGVVIHGHCQSFVHLLGIGSTSFLVLSHGGLRGSVISLSSD